MAKTETDHPVRVPDPSGSGLDSYFKITERGSTVRTEVIAGITTFLTMGYILFVNPQILGLVTDKNGTALAFPQVLTVTALAAGVMTLAMGLYARYPFAIAAGLGLNGFVAFTLVGTMGLTWPQAMGVIVIEGAIISVLVLTRVREWIINAIPMDLKRAIGIGIGLFLAIIGLHNAGIVVLGNDAVPVTIAANLTTLRILTFVVGLVLAAALVARKTKGALLISILGTTVFATLLNIIWGNKAIWDAVGPGIAQIPSRIFDNPDFGLVGKVNFGVFSVLGFATAAAAIVSVMLSDFFDTAGTVMGIADEAGMLDEDGKLPGMNRVLFVDSLAAAVGGLTSSSSNTTYIESASGVSEGGRTGLASVVTGVLFLLCLFISPVAGIIPPEATAPVLVIVAYFMIQSIGQIDWRDPGIGIPALLTMVLMPFTYSITNGVGVGFLSYVVIRTLQGRAKDIHPLLWLVAGIFAWYFVHGLLA